MKILQHKFVEFIPDVLEDGTLYISIEYCTAIHKCVCGCGNEVVTPLSPTDWQLTFDGKNVSLSPSIGNWNFECKSHYFIKKNQVRLARNWNDWEITDGRKSDVKKKKKYFKRKKKS
jgi:hypothetical protein